MTITINGTVMTSYFDPYSFRFSYEKVSGPNTGTAIDGTSILDQVAVKTVIEMTAGLMSAADFATLVGLFNLETVTVTFVDPSTNASRTIDMIPSISDSPQFPCTDSSLYYKNLKVKLREK